MGSEAPATSMNLRKSPRASAGSLAKDFDSDRVLIVDSIDDLILVLDSAPNRECGFVRSIYVPGSCRHFWRLPQAVQLMRRSRIRTVGGNCADAFLTSILQIESSEFGMSMRTRASFVSAACLANPNQVP